MPKSKNFECRDGIRVDDLAEEWSKHLVIKEIKYFNKFRGRSLLD